MSNTVIGGGLTIEGEITSQEDVVVQGRVKGRLIVEGTIYLEQAGIIDADVSTGNIEVGGRLTGNIIASEKVEIVPGGQALGDITAQRILIAEGAVFKGNVDMGV